MALFTCKYYFIKKNIYNKSLQKKFACPSLLGPQKKESIDYYNWKKPIKYSYIRSCKINILLFCQKKLKINYKNNNIKSL